MTTQNTEFYNTNEIAEVSHRGYYPEKARFIKEYLDTNIRRLKKNVRSRILDIACNDGVLTHSYLKYGEVIGVDINKRAIAATKKKGIKAFCMDISELSESYNESFDVIIAGDIIEHIFDSDAFLMHINRLLKPGGSLLLTTPNVASFPRRILLLLGINPYLEYSVELPSREYNVGHVRYYTAADLRKQLEHHHLTVEEIRGDKVNLGIFSLTGKIAAMIPTLSRNLMVRATKQ